MTADDDAAMNALTASKAMFDELRPHFEQMIQAARIEHAYYLAFAASHMLDSIDVFGKQVERYIVERRKRS